MQHILGLILLTLPFARSPASDAPKGGCYILRVSQDTSKLQSRRIRSLMRGYGMNLRKVYPSYQKGFLACAASEASLGHLKSQGLFTYIEEDRAVKSLQIQKDAPWGLSRLSNPNLPISGSYTFQRTGKGVNVYILDSGVIAGHPEFSGRAANVHSEISTTHGQEDCSGHGTQVASIIAGTNVGVAKRASIKAVRILDCDGQGANLRPDCCHTLGAEQS